LLFIDEAGEIAEARRAWGPEVPDVERELAQTHVIAPAIEIMLSQ
jgi:hypothetical protein